MVLSLLRTAALVGIDLLGLLGLSFFFLFMVMTWKARNEHARVPAEIPWVGLRDEAFSSIRANWRGWTTSKDLYMEGYERFSKEDVVHVVPAWTRGPQIMLPPSMAPWLASVSTKILNAKAFAFNTVQFEHTVGHPEIPNNDMVELLIRRELTRSTGTPNSELLEELDAAMKDLIGGDGDFKKVSVYNTMGGITGRITNRIFVGKELCSNQQFLASVVRFAESIGATAVILHFFPVFMRRVIASFATIPSRRASAKALQYLEPLVRQRIADMKQAAADPTYPWMAPKVVAILREEAQRVLAEYHGTWTKSALAKLVRLDSAMWESARVSGIGGSALARRVEADLMLPNGLVIPKSNYVGVSMDGVHFDEDIYPRAHEYDAFRFSRPREEAEFADSPYAPEDLLTTSPHFLFFSHGMHACPGRFFAANNLKLILAHLLINYEIQPFSKRPENIPVGDILAVPRTAEMFIRRRVKA
ncbi:cytochrome P450 [Mycena filopes]|nr:cytochrome P450 [Mycena filopes]